MKKLMWLSILIAFLSVCTLSFSGPPPDTGQTKCYDNSGRIPCPLPGEAFDG